MKRFLALAMTLALLSGCGGGVTPAPEPEDSAPKIELPEPEPAGETETISCEFNYVRMSLELPANWGYALVGFPVDDGHIHVQPAEAMGIRFWPDAAEDMGGGALALYCYADLFAVCGTGLETREIELSSGLTGSMGTYDENPLWSFIRLYDTPGSYVIQNEGADVWWDDYGGQAMTILDSVRVGKGLLKESGAVEIAKTACNVDYNTVRPTFDRDTGEWEVHFYHDTGPGGGQSVWIGPDGEILKTESGE